MVEGYAGACCILYPLAEDVARAVERHTNNPKTRY